MEEKRFQSYPFHVEIKNEDGSEYIKIYNEKQHNMILSMAANSGIEVIQLVALTSVQTEIREFPCPAMLFCEKSNMEDFIITVRDKEHLKKIKESFKFGDCEKLGGHSHMKVIKVIRDRRV